MSVDAHLQDIRCLVGDKVLLDVADLAKVLDRTPVAIQRLINKKKLPFAVKRIDSRYQVTARSVAEWLAREEGLLPSMHEAATEDVWHSGSNGNRRGAEARHSVVPELNPAQAPALSPYAVKILQSREESRRQFKRFIDGLADADEQAFGRELFAELYFQQGELSKLYIVNHSWMAPRSCRLRSKSTQYYYSDLRLAECRTLNILSHHRYQPRLDRLVEVSLWSAGDLLFKASVIEGDIRIETNIARFALYGI